MNKLLSALALALTLTAQSACAAPEYLDLTPAQLTSVAKGKIEVVEFFWYGCSHCFNLEPDLNQWSKKLPKGVVLKRVPAVLNDNWSILARAYYAMEAIGAVDKLHVDLFEAIHLNGMRFNDANAFLDWAATKGVDRRKLADAYDSFSVSSRVMRAQQMTREYKLNGVPAVAVNGKYLTNATLAGGQPQLFKVVDQLIAKEQKAGKSSAKK